MAKFNKLNSAIDRMMTRLDQLEAQGVDITNLADPVKVAARREIDRRNAAVSARKVERARTAAVTNNTFVVGQMVRHMRGMIAPAMVAAVDGSTITLDTGRKFAAAAFVAA